MEAAINLAKSRDFSRRGRFQRQVIKQSVFTVKKYNNYILSIDTRK